jgi:hypothetical protein
MRKVELCSNGPVDGVRLICTLQRKLNYVVDKSGAKMRPAAAGEKRRPGG